MPRQGYRSAGDIFRRISTCALACVVIISALVTTPQRASANTLDNVSVKTTTLLPNFASTQIDIFFVLPPNAQQIRPDEYIQIELPNYRDIALPLSIVGGFSTPTASLDGTTIKITNVTLLPGTSMNITGIELTNPSSGQSNEIIVSITEDEAGTQVRNTVTTQPSEGGNQISVTTTIQAPLSALSINGFTSPNSFVILSENGTTISTTIAGGTGAFSFNMTAIVPGAHSYVIFSTDTENRSTTQTSRNYFLLANTLTTVNNILLSPTISISETEIDPGEPITISGKAKPNSTISVFIEGPLRAYSATTNANGEWSYTILGSETALFSPGQYIAYSLVQDGASNQSLVSPTLSFTVTSPTTDNPPPACDITRGDLNCNGVTNLVDFSILLFHWNTTNRVADINNDSLVNLIDFSIMMFYFTAS
jgi:hypothetical protein